VVGWDKPASFQVVEPFLATLAGLVELKNVSFPRSIQPCGQPILMMFGDASWEAYCAMGYICWLLEDGSTECTLLASKTRVAPKKKQSFPRLELIAATLMARLAKKIVETFRFEFLQIFYFTDSSAVLGMLQKDSCTFLEFVGNRVSEIKSLSPVESWSWVPTDKNPADWGTRGKG